MNKNQNITLKTMSVEQNVVTYGTSCNSVTKKGNHSKVTKNADIVRCTGLSHIIQLHKSLFQHLVHIEVLFFSM